MKLSDEQLAEIAARVVAGCGPDEWVVMRDDRRALLGHVKASSDGAAILLKTARDHAESLIEERDRLRAELAEAKRDAERYRFLKKAACCRTPDVFSIYENVGHDWVVPNDLDSSIDAAIAKEKQT